MTKIHSLDYTMEREIEGVEEPQELLLCIDYSWIPGVPEQGPSYASGGQPAEGPEIEIREVWLEKGVSIELTPEEHDRAIEYIYTNHAEDGPDDY